MFHAERNTGLAAARQIVVIKAVNLEGKRFAVDNNIKLVSDLPIIFSVSGRSYRRNLHPGVFRERGRDSVDIAVIHAVVAAGRDFLTLAGALDRISGICGGNGDDRREAVRYGAVIGRHAGALYGEGHTLHARAERDSQHEHFQLVDRFLDRVRVLDKLLDKRIKDSRRAGRVRVLQLANCRIINGICGYGIICHRSVLLKTRRQT